MFHKTERVEMVEMCWSKAANEQRNNVKNMTESQQQQYHNKTPQN